MLNPLHSESADIYKSVTFEVQGPGGNFVYKNNDVFPISYNETIEDEKGSLFFTLTMGVVTLAQTGTGQVDGQNSASTLSVVQPESLRIHFDPRGGMSLTVTLTIGGA